MLTEGVKKKLQETKPERNKNIGRLIYKLYRYFVSWQEEKCPDKYLYKIKPSQVALLANINVYGGNNKELAQRASVSKQAMSKLLNEIEKEGIVEIERDKDDCRSNNIELTDKGAELLISMWEINHLMVEDFEKHLGTAKTQLFLELLSELVDSIGYCGPKDKETENLG